MRRSLLILVVVAGCHGKRADKDYFGTQVSPPGLLAQLRPGMTLAQVKAIAPDAKDDPEHGLLLATPKTNLKLYAMMDHDLVKYTYADYAGEDVIAVLTQAWGPPDKEPDREDHDDIAWRSTTTGWRAAVFCGHGTEKVKIPPFCTIKFHPYLPLENMFGKQIAPPGQLAKVTPRMALAQLKATSHVAELTDKPAQTPIRSLDYDGVTESIGVVDGRLYMLSYTVPEAARAMIEKAWGAPVVEGKQALWFDPKTGWSASLEASSSDPHELDLEYQGYQPFLAEVGILETLAAAPTAADAKRSHPELEWDPTAKSDDQPVLVLASNEFTDPVYRSARMVPVSLFGNSVAVRVVMGQLDPAKEPAIVDALTRKWGAPKKTTAKDGVVEYRFAKHGLVIHEGDTLGVHVGTDV
jgi:hypothetical protein